LTLFCLIDLYSKVTYNMIKREIKVKTETLTTRLSKRHLKDIIKISFKLARLKIV